MKKKVKLKDVTDGMELQTDGVSYYVNKEAGEVTVVMAREFEIAEEDDDSLISMYGLDKEGVELARAILLDDKGVFIRLPTEHQIHGWELMNQFSRSLADENMSESLLNAIHGKGAFRHFKDTLQRFGIEKQWFAYREAAYRKIAIEWCEANDIEYI